jgi:hypothetical protein
MPLSPTRVATSHLQAADDVWLPDYLGTGAPVADAAMRLVKEIVRDSSTVATYRTTPQAAAGGILYTTLQAANLDMDAKKMWPILDRNAGLHVGGDMRHVGEKVFHALMRGMDPGDREAKALRIGALGVELLQRTRQPSKAKLVNRIFAEKYGDALAALQPGRSKAPLPSEALRVHIDAEMVSEAKKVADLIQSDKAKALAFISYVLTDVNFHSLAQYAPSSAKLSDEETASARDIAGYLQYGVEEAAAFGVALLEAVGMTEMAGKFERIAIRVGLESGLFSTRLAGDAYTGNPNGQGIYPNEIDHGYTEPLAGGTDVMRKLQNQFLHEQGREQRPDSPRLAAEKYKTPAVRNPFYSLSDGAVGMESAVKSEGHLSKDAKLVGLVGKVVAATDALHKYLNATYIWD